MARQAPVMASMPDPILGLKDILYVTKDIPPSMGGQPSESRVRELLDKGIIRGGFRDPKTNERKVALSAVTEWVQSLQDKANADARGRRKKMDERERQERVK